LHRLFRFEPVSCCALQFVFAGIKIVAYSPLGRGFLTGTIRSLSDPALDGHDYRKISPKFANGNLDTNLALVDAVQGLADSKGCTVGQLALAWLHAQGPDVIPIPGKMHMYTHCRAWNT
jgi:aryl-alcohol dehydrogenase-like predicted oxidoreductase